MARQNGIHFIGRMGNIVGSTWKGIPYLRHMPEKINQSQATKQSCTNLAIASQIGAAFRKSFGPLLPQPTDRSMQNRFTGAIKKWLQTKPFEQPLPVTTLPYLTGFDFNEASPVQARFRVAVNLQENEERLWELHIASFVPERNIAVPACTKAVTINIAIASCHINSVAITQYYFHQLSISYDNNVVPGQFIPLPFCPEKGNVTLVLLSLQYCTSGGMITDLPWLPCGVTAAYLK